MIFHLCTRCNVLLTKIYVVYNQYEVEVLIPHGTYEYSDISNTSHSHNECPICSGISESDPDNIITTLVEIEFTKEIASKILDLQEKRFEEISSEDSNYYKWDSGVLMSDPAVIDLIVEDRL